VHHLDGTAAGHARQHIAPAIHSGISGVARQSYAQCLHHAGHCRGRTHGHAVAVAAVHAAFGFKKVGQLKRSRAYLLTHAPHARARAQLLAAPFAAQHGAAADAHCGQVDAGRAHHQGWRGLVATHQQHHAVDGVAAYAFFNVHAGQVAVEHGGGAQQGFAQRHHRKFEREAPRFVNAYLDLLGNGAEMRIAGCQFAEGVADADDGAAVELVMRYALALDPAAVGKTVAVLSAEPMLAAQFFGFLFGFAAVGHVLSA
jgi:hypothetical protein